MSGEGKRDHWQEVYETKSPTEVSWFQNEPVVALELIDGLGVEPSEPIIDVGGGASTLVDHLLERECTDVTVLDISAAALAVAKERLTGRAEDVTWLAEDLMAWSPARQFAVWHDRAVLHFLTDAADRRRYGEILSAAVAPGGHAVIGTFALGGPTHCSGLEVQQHDAASVAALAGPDFEVVDSRAEHHVTPAGHAQDFSWVVLRHR
ncbi:MAG: class I SAM-dependent methyltransferase [Aeromicrobium sp.]